MNPFEIIAMFCSLSSGYTCTVDINEELSKKHLFIMMIRTYDEHQTETCYDVVINHQQKDVSYNKCSKNMLRDYRHG
jgi:3,4-dihydroxy-2-butanone 4-phosphate synthase